MNIELYNIRRMKCKIDDCEGTSKARGWCNRHWYRWYRYGDTEFVKHIKNDDEKRFWSFVNKTEKCWEWIGYKDIRGYGQVSFKGQIVTAHRMAWQLLVGKLPDYKKTKMTIDHLCKNTSCVNPSHMEIVSSRENTFRSNNICMQNKAKKYCVNGHKLSGRNLATTKASSKRGISRVCKECAAIRNKKYHKKIKSLGLIG